MTQVTYHAPDGDNAVVTMGGVRFFDGQAVDLDETDPELGHLFAKLKGNWHFEVSEGEADKPSKEPAKDPDALMAKHNGGGRYIIVRGDDTISAGLTKDDAAAFNAMTPAEQVEYVKSTNS